MDHFEPLKSQEVDTFLAQPGVYQEDDSFVSDDSMSDDEKHAKHAPDKKDKVL